MIYLSEELKKYIKESCNLETILKFVNSNDINVDVNYFDVAVDDPTKISYVPKNRIDQFDGKFWDKDLRKDKAMMARIGRVFKKVNINLTQKEVEALQAKLIEYLTPSIDIVSGEDIRYYYNYHNYCTCNNTDTLSSSCMKHDECSEYFGIYVHEPYVTMAIHKCPSCGKIDGRALIWNNVKHLKLGEITWMDRAYGNNQIREMFKNYALKNKIYFKREQTYSNSDLIDPITGTIVHNATVVKLTNQYKYFPYMDTVKYRMRDELATYRNHGTMMDATDGNTYCYNCGSSGCSTYKINDKYYCGSCKELLT